MRITLADIRQSRLPAAIGLCSGNIPEIAAAVSAAQSRLVEAAGEQGWWGGWVKVVFPVDPTNPYITLPRQFCRIINLDVCNDPIRLHNEFFEVLPGGVGLKNTITLDDWCGNIAGYERGTSPTMVDIEDGMIVRAYATNVLDYGKKLLVNAPDTNDLTIYALDGSPGFYLTLAAPFVQTAYNVNGPISSVLKDVTVGDVLLKQVDPTTGVETTLSRYATTEINPSYRRYFITQLPNGCCTTASGTVNVTAICKYECLPVYQDTDQLLIQSTEALVEECKALRLADMETDAALKQSEYHHAKAIKLLQNQLRHYEGEQQVAANVNRYKDSPLDRQWIGSMI